MPNRARCTSFVSFALFVLIRVWLVAAARDGRARVRSFTSKA